VGGRALGRSVAFKAGGISILGGDVCERGGVEWKCYAASDGSSSAEYRVRSDPRGCWTAHLSQRGPRRSPRRASGCISILDYARPVQRFLGVAGD